MTGAAERFRRLMALLPRCAAESKLSLTALSTELGAPVAEILADLAALTERANDPPGYLDPIGVLIEGDTVTVRSDHFRRPMRLTAAELCALELGLAVLEREAHGDEARACVQLREKLARCITRLPQDAVHDGLRDGAFTAPHDIDVLSRLRTALRRSCTVTLDYQAAHATAPTSRTVRPYRLIFSRGSWYLAGWCEQSAGLRLFRTDRIRALTVTSQVCPVPADFDPDVLIQDGHPFVVATAPADLTVRYSPAIARWIAERDGGPLEPDGSALRTMPLADREWAVRHVLQYGPDATVVAPEELRQEVTLQLEGMLTTSPAP